MWDQSYIIIESNSQPEPFVADVLIVVWDQSYIIIESNSQRTMFSGIGAIGCVGSKLHNN